MAEETDRDVAAQRRQMTLVGGGALMLALVLAAAWFFLIRVPYGPAFSGLKTGDAALIVEELKKLKTPYKLADNGTTIQVPSDQIDATRLSILGGDLPLKGMIGFELFNESDMGVTEFAQKINYQRALQGELARTLMSFDTIESARVHITLPDEGLFRDDRRPAKASVTVAPKLGKTVDGRAIIGIQRLVASAVEGLEAINVVVLDASGRQLSGEFGGVAVGDPADAQLDPQEQHYASLIRAAVAPLVADPAFKVLVMMPPPLSLTDPAMSTPPRRAPIRTTITIGREPEVALRAKLVTALEGAIGFDEKRGDSLLLTAGPVRSPFEVGAPVATANGSVRPRADWEPDAAPSVSAALLWGLLAAGIAAALAWLIWTLLRKRRVNPLSNSEREEFALQLQDLVARRGEAGHGRS